MVTALLMPWWSGLSALLLPAPTMLLSAESTRMSTARSSAGTRQE